MPKRKKKKAKNPNRVRAGKRSKAKGSAWERWIANDLEARYGDPELPIKARNFRRTPMSGGFRIQSPGDLEIPDWFPFAIEAKKYNSAEDVLDLTTIPLKGENHQLLKWWDEEYAKAQAIKKDLLIVFCKGRHKPLVLMRMETLLRLDRHLARGVTKEKVTVMAITSYKHDLVCVPYSVLFDRLDKDTLSQFSYYLKEGSPAIKERAELEVLP